jgi:hypothetical protein
MSPTVDHRAFSSLPEAQTLLKAQISFLAICDRSHQEMNTSSGEMTRWIWSGGKQHDPEKCAAIFRKDHAQSKNQSAMTIRPNLIAL